MATEITLGDRKIGPNEPPFVIAEVGINHEGELEKALACVDAAAAAGADCVKFQTHIVDKEMIPTDMTPSGISDEPLWQIIERCQLDAEEERKVAEHCGEVGITFLSTPFSFEAAVRLRELGVPGFKIGSGELNNLPFIDRVARWHQPMLLSTGMNDLASVARTVAVLEKHKCPYALLHCTSVYPTPYALVRLDAITQLITEFAVPVGSSDHSLGVHTAIAAVALGACILEKHFTIDRGWPGPDNPFSIEPNELAQLVEGARAVYEARGRKDRVLAEEQSVADFAFECVVTTAPIARGATFTTDNVWVKRPGTGPILADRLGDVLGQTATRDLLADVQVAASDVYGFST